MPPDQRARDNAQDAHGQAPQDLPHRRRTRDQPPRLRRDAHHRQGHLGPAGRERLGVEQIALWQLHRIDSKVPRDEQFDAVKLLLDDGVITHAGLSEVSVEDIEAASKIFPVTTVQDRYNFADRGSEDVLKYCEAHGIGFIPWFPLAAGELTREGSALDAIAKAHGATQSQIAVAWLLQRSPVIIPVPGTSKVAHLEENVKAGEIELTPAEFETLDKVGLKR